MEDPNAFPWPLGVFYFLVGIWFFYKCREELRKMGERNKPKK